MAPEHVLSARTRRLLIKLGIGLGVLVAARVGYHFWQTGWQGRSASSAPVPAKGVMRKVTLVLDPPDTSVQIDHIPTAKRELALDSATPHLLNATAPGRLDPPVLVRSQAWAQAGGAHEPPAGAALASRPTARTRRAVRGLSRIAAPIGRNRRCPGQTGQVRPVPGCRERQPAKAATRPRPAPASACTARTWPAARPWCARRVTWRPPSPRSRARPMATFPLCKAGQKLEAVMRASAALRAELLAARSEWQWQELALQEKLDGRKAAWHMRRFALGANAWLRAMKSDPPARQSVDERASALSDIYSMFLDYAESARAEMARTTGANDFMKAAQDTMAVVRPTDGKPRSEFAALGACRRLVAAFNALVVE